MYKKQLFAREIVKNVLYQTAFAIFGLYFLKTHILRMARSILLIDDDNDDSELFYEALEELDPSVKFMRTADGCEALELLGGQEEHPDVIFLDINMPRMDGWECLLELKNREDYKSIPVIMYSTSSHQKEKDRAIELGAARFISKPDSYAQLIQVLQTAIREF